MKLTIGWLLLTGSPAWGFVIASPFLPSSMMKSTNAELGNHHRMVGLDDYNNYHSNGDDYYHHMIGYDDNGNDHHSNNGDDQHNSFNNLSVSELKRLLMERGVDFRDCLEKRDLVERLLSSTLVRSSQQQDQRFSTPPLDPLTAHEQGIIQTFKKASPSVAYIQTTSTVAVRNGFTMRGMEVPAGTGSGFLWDRNGHVVTNYHVVAGRGGPAAGGSSSSSSSLPARVTVKLTGMAKPIEAEVVGVEPEKDIAVLKLKDTSNLPMPIDVGTSHDLQVGQSVLAIGNPYALDNTLTTGVVSAIGRDLDGVGGRPIRNCIQTDASINPGNSGGPLLDSRGRLIGVNTAIFSPNRGMAGSVGIGFAIPVDTVTQVVNQIIRYGKTDRPTMGLNVIGDRIVKSIEQQLGRTLGGVLIAEVLPNSPAAAAGLQASQLRSDGSIELGDMIARIDGKAVKETEDLILAIEEKQEGDIVELVVWRKSDPRRVETVRVQLTTRVKLEAGQQFRDTRNGVSSSSARRSRDVNTGGSVNPFSFWQ